MESGSKDYRALWLARGEELSENSEKLRRLREACTQAQAALEVYGNRANWKPVAYGLVRGFLMDANDPWTLAQKVLKRLK